MGMPVQLLVCPLLLNGKASKDTGLPTAVE